MADLSPYDSIIESAAKQHGMDPNEVRAIIQTESNGNPKAASHDKQGNVLAAGLMQVNLHAHPGMMKDPYDPAENINAGTSILADAYKSAAAHGYKGNDLKRAAWSTYNGGPGVLDKAKAEKNLPEDHTESGKYGNYPTTVQYHLDQIGGKPTQPTVTTDHTQTLGDHDDQGSGADLETLPNGNVAFRNRIGEMTEVSPDDAADAFYRRGMKPVPRDEYIAEKTEQALRAKYGSGLKNALEAGGEGAINGLFADAGDAALVKAGIEPAEAIKAHEKYFGGTRKATNAAAFLGSQFIGEGEAQDAVRAGKAAADVGEGAKALEAAKGAKGLLTAGEDAAQAAPKELPGSPVFKGIEAPPEEVTPDQIISERSTPQANYGADRGSPSKANPDDVRQAYDDISKKYGKDFADRMMKQDSDAARQALSDSPAVGEATNAGGGKDLYSPEGVNQGASDIRPEFDLSKADEPNGYTPPERPGQPLPPRPEGIQEPLPPEGHAEPIPKPPPASQQTIDAEFSEVPKPAGALPAPESAPAGAPTAAPAVPGAPPAAPLPTAADLATQAAQLVTKPNRAIWGMGEHFGKAVEDAMGGGTWGKVFGNAASGAAQSVPFTVGHNLSEATLNDEKITPERLFAGGIGNAMLSGGLGGAFGLASEGLGKLNLKFKSMADQINPAEKLANVAKSFNAVRDGTEQFSKAVYQGGLKYERFNQLLGNSDNLVKGPGPAQWQKLVNDTAAFLDPLDGKSGVAQKAKSAWDEFVVAKSQAQNDAQIATAADQFKRKISELYHEELRINPTNRAFADQLNNVKQSWIRGIEDEQTFGPVASMQRELNDAWENLIAKNTKKSPIFSAFMRKGLLDGEGDIVFDEAKLNHYLRQVGSDNPDHAAVADLRSKILKEWLDAHRDYAGILKQHIYDPLQRGHEISGFHDFLGADDGRIAKTIADMQDLTQAQKKTMWSRLLSSHSMRYGAAMGLMAAGVPHAFMMTWGVSTVLNHLLGNGLGASGFADALANHGQRFSTVLNESMDRAFKGGSYGAGAVGIFKELQLTPQTVSSKDRHDQAAEVATHLAQVVNDPTTPQRLQASTGMLNIAHPELAAALQAKAMQALTYLQDKAPKDPLPPSPFNTVPFRPGHAAVASFENVAEVVANPLVLVRDFGNGSLSSEQVEAAETIYPEILNQIRTAAMDRMPQYAKDMKYQQRLALGKLLGTPLDWSASPDAVQSLQKTYNMPKPGSGDPSKGGAANQKKPTKPNSAKQETMLADSTQLNLQSALSQV